MLDSIVAFVYWLAGGTVTVLLVGIALTSIIERHTRATLVASLGVVVWITVWLIGNLCLDYPWMIQAVMALAVVLGGLLLLAPSGRINRLKTRPSQEKADERDTVFAREEYEAGTPPYDEYYQHHPELKRTDDRLRSLPPLMKPGGRYYDPIECNKIQSTFGKISAYTTKVDGPVAATQRQFSAATMTSELKKLVLTLGADDVGIARLDQRWVYSHVGRGPEPWGAPIDNRHRYGIAYLLEMDFAAVDQAPRLAITAESGRQYLRGAQLSVKLARTIRSWGYSARAHISDSNYQAILPAVAADAGLGELGRMGYLINERLGARVRLGLVTTDLPLVVDEPISFGVQDFCQKCLKCATNCPSGAIPKGEKEWVRGVAKWPLKAEACLHYWRAIGTDCGLCMRVCPYSHPPTVMHNIVRCSIKRSAVARSVAALGDDLLYGRKVPYPRHEE